MKPPKDEALETAAPQRNFTLTTEERIRAAAGPAAYMSRRRSIEDLEAALLAAMVEFLRTLPEGSKEFDRALVTMRARGKITSLNKLIEAHNRYYPCEANLPLDPATGAMLERGEPWKPLEKATIESLVLRARAMMR